MSRCEIPSDPHTVNCPLVPVTSQLHSSMPEVKHGKTAKGRSIWTRVGAVMEPWETDPKFLWWTVTLKAHLISGRDWKGRAIRCSGSRSQEREYEPRRREGRWEKSSSPASLVVRLMGLRVEAAKKPESGHSPGERACLCVTFHPYLTARLAASHLEPEIFDFQWSHQPHNSKCVLGC